VQEAGMSALETRHLQTYRELFVHRPDIFARQTPTGSYFLVRSGVTEDLIRKHLLGQLTAGWYSLGRDNTVRWVVLDADRPDGLESLQEAWKQLDARGISAQLELSRRGGHLWIFFEPMVAQVARRLILGSLPDLSGVEVFPKQEVLGASRSVGNLVRGPLGVHQRTGKRYAFVDPVSLTPVCRTISGTIDYLGSVERLRPPRVAEHLAQLLNEASRPPMPSQPVLASAPRPSRQSAGQIKERLGDPYSFISRYVSLDQSGRGSCPFHPPDSHPSFAVNRQRGYWVCFHEINPRTGRYIGGDVIDFYRRLHNLSYKDTLTELWDLCSDAGTSEQDGKTQA
jgi:hypothetical protein